VSDLVPIRGVIYARKSTADKKDSIGTQIEDCLALAARDGISVAGADIFSEEKASAYQPKFLRANHETRRDERVVAAAERAVRVSTATGTSGLLVA